VGNILFPLRKASVPKEVLVHFLFDYRVRQDLGDQDDRGSDKQEDLLYRKKLLPSLFEAV
jgi:hypothetical protein